MRRAESRGAVQGRRARAGFTLVEVTVALAIGALTVLGARMLLENLGEGASRITAAARQGDRDANGERLLRSLVGQIEVGTRTTFSGDERSARFTTWCETESGWSERCRIALAVQSTDTGPVLTTAMPNGDRLVVRTARRSLRLRYLVDARQGGTWFVSWGDGLLVPRAIGVISDADTLIVRIGERG